MVCFGKKSDHWAIFFEDRIIKGDNCLGMLQNYFIPQLEQLNLKDDIMFQQDGAPCHFALRVRQFLDQEFFNRWIGRGGQFYWPPRSPDLTPLDFFLWGHVKTIVYATKPTPLKDLKAKITNMI